MRLFVSLALTLTPFGVAFAQNPLASRVLLVYVDGDSDSQSVAAHYAQAREIPSSDLCAVMLPNPAATSLDGADYTTYLKQPIQSCLLALGEASILYVVLAYV